MALCCHFPTTQLQLLWLNYGSMTGWSVYVCACALVVITKEPIENRAPSNFLGSDIDTAPQGSFNNYVVMILAFFCPPTYCYVDSFTLHIRQKWTFLDHLPISSRPRSYWTTPDSSYIERKGIISKIIRSENWLTVASIGCREVRIKLWNCWPNSSSTTNSVSVIQQHLGWAQLRTAARR